MHSVDSSPVVAFMCSWEAWRAYLDWSKSGDQPPANLRPVRIPCVGRMDPALILAALERGAGGVLVAGCQKGECRHGPGPARADEEAQRMLKLLHLLGLDKERLNWLEADPSDSDAFGEHLSAFVRQSRKMGPTAWARRAEG
jgi:coenzyme F420-reducing hydrogenase delta subunit